MLVPALQFLRGQLFTVLTVRLSEVIVFNRAMSKVIHNLFDRNERFDDRDDGRPDLRDIARLSGSVERAKDETKP